MRWHFSDETGRPERCRAEKGGCPYESSPHFETRDEVLQHYESQRADDLIPTLSKEPSRLLTFSENNSTLSQFGYESRVKAEGKINPEELNEDSWRDFGFTGPEILKRKSSIDELTFYNMASDQELEQLTDEEKDAVEFFTSSDFAEFNRAVFNGGEVDPEKQEAFDELINKIDSGLGKNPGLTKVVYRGVKTRASAIGLTEDDDYYSTEKKVREYVEDNFKVGESVSFSGYQSTSLDPYVATSWAERDGIVFEIMSPKGVNITSISRNPEETEVLMPRNTRYMVVGVQDSKEIGFAYRSKPSHIIQLVAVDEDNNIL